MLLGPLLFRKSFSFFLEKGSRNASPFCVFILSKGLGFPELVTWSLHAEALIPALENCVSDILQFLHYWRILKVSLTMDKGDDDSISIPKFYGSRWAWSRCRFYRPVPSVYPFTTKTNWLGNWRLTPVETLWNFVWYTKTPKTFPRIISGDVHVFFIKTSKQ